jgi:hypothetical protein
MGGFGASSSSRRAPRLKIKVDRVEHMPNQIAALAVGAAHLALVAYVVYVPFFGDRNLLRLYAFAMPFLYIHWFTNDDTCFLTLVEKRLRGDAGDAGFLERIISPVYKFQGGRASNAFVWVASLFLWTVAVLRIALFPHKQY